MKKQLLNCIEKLDTIKNTVEMMNYRMDENNFLLIAVRRDFAKLLYSCFGLYKAEPGKKFIDCDLSIYNASKKYGLVDYLLRILHSKTVLEIMNGKLEKALVFCKEGYSYSVKFKKEIQRYTFASIMFFIKTKLRKTSFGRGNDYILEYYNSIKYKLPANLWKIMLENTIVMSYFPEKRKEIKEVLKEQINSNILLGDYSFAVYWKFVVERDAYDELLQRYLLLVYHEDSEYLEMSKVKEKIFLKISSICSNTLCYDKALKEYNILWLVYITQLSILFFSEKPYNTEQSKYLIAKLAKLAGKQYEHSRFELLKLSFKMTSLISKPKLLLSRYEYKLKKTIDNYKSNPAEINIIDYAILSSLARRLRCSAVTQMVREFYRWLSDKHPEILAPVMREIEERKAKIYVVDGSKQTAQNQSAA